MRQQVLAERDKAYLLTIPVTDMSKTPLDLPLPNKGNAGGFRVINHSYSTNDGVACTGTSFAYSPIDISVASLTALYNGEQSVSDLSKWFINNTYRVAEIWLSCTVKSGSVVLTHTIAEWKIITLSDDKLLRLFKKNAPFTFRR